MGIIDEHWCTLCKKKLDKSKDKYIDFELIHQASAPVVKNWRKPKGLICMECIEKDPKLKEVFDAILKAGNPTFLPEITCLSAAICGTHQVSSKPLLNCRHIAVIGDTVYCKRSHPGNVKLAVERAERIRVENQYAVKFIKRAFGKLPEGLRDSAEKMFTSNVKTMWTPPSQVVRVMTTEEIKKSETLVGKKL
jgi:hypothetical protein